MRSHKHLAGVRADYGAAQSAGVRFRPTFDIDGERLTGALPFGEFQSRIEAALAR
jgi:protein-disulfide isomerase